MDTADKNVIQTITVPALFNFAVRTRCVLANLNISIMIMNAVIADQGTM